LFDIVENNILRKIGSCGLNKRRRGKKTKKESNKLEHVSDAQAQKIKKSSGSSPGLTEKKTKRKGEEAHGQQPYLGYATQSRMLPNFPLNLLAFSPLQSGANRAGPVIPPALTLSSRPSLTVHSMCAP